MHEIKLVGEQYSAPFSTFISISLITTRMLSCLQLGLFCDRMSRLRMESVAVLKLQVHTLGAQIWRVPGKSKPFVGFTLWFFSSLVSIVERPHTFNQGPKN